MTSARLNQAFQETEYWVATEPPTRWLIGQPHPDWAQRQAEFGVSCATWLTAHNPQSRQQSAAANAHAHRRLCQALDSARWRWLSGWAQHPDNGWPIEHGVVVLGMDRAAAHAWGRRFGQRAVVCTDAAGIADLCWMA